MTKTLVISDNEILNQLYLINLEVYLATNVELVFTTLDAQLLIDSGNKFDLILTVNMIGGQDSALAISNFLKAKKLDIPMVIIGNPTIEIPNSTIIQSSYHLENLLRSCAKILGITSKSMTALELPDYYKIETKFLILLKHSPCQIFLQVKHNNEEDSYTMIAKKESETSDVIKKLSSEGIIHLYVKKMDRLLVIGQISTNLCERIKNTKDSGLEEKSFALEAGFDFVGSGFCQTAGATLEVVSLANSCSKLMEEISNDTPGLRHLINLMKKNSHGYIFTHSILASFVASHVVKNVSWGGESQLEKINFVLFFHDIMLAPIYFKYPNLKYEEDLLFNDELSEAEKLTVLNHAHLAAELIITFRKAPMGVDLLIKQHHGMTNGIGFAMEFREDISPFSKIVLISEAFVEEFMKEKDKEPNFQIDLQTLLTKLSEKFNRSTYRKIISTLETIRL